MVVQVIHLSKTAAAELAALLPIPLPFDVFVNFNFESKFGFYSNIARADTPATFFRFLAAKSAPTILVIRIPFSADFLMIISSGSF
jgi:hypothetical protein